MNWRNKAASDINQPPAIRVGGITLNTMEQENKVSFTAGGSISFCPTYDNDGMWVHVYSADRRTHMLLGPINSDELSAVAFSARVANMILDEKQTEKQNESK